MTEAHCTSFGTDPDRLYRKDAPATSKDAAHRVNTQTDEEKVFRMIENSRKGLTIKECARRLNKFPHQISGRFTALKAKKMIEQTTERREHSYVMKVVRKQVELFTEK